MASITLRDLTKQFGGGAPAVNRLNLELREGELVAFLGPSGCGKTTTLRMVAGFEMPSSGEILFGETPVTSLQPEKRNIGMVFQNYALFPHLTVKDNVGFGLEMRGVPKAEIAKRVAEILAKMQLGHLAERYPRQLSGGQQQRAALARAMVINPQVLLLDEPLANLDAKLREEMRFFIRRLQQEYGITTIFVTHDQSEAMVLADRIAVIMNGVLQQVDVPEEIYRHPVNRQVAAFIGLTNFVPGKVVAREGDVLTVETQVGRLQAAGPASISTGADVFLSIRPETLRIADAAGVNTVEGVVRERAYLGNLIDYQVELSPDLQFRIQSSPSRHYQPGDKVQLQFDASEAWTVPGDGR